MDTRRYSLAAFKLYDAIAVIVCFALARSFSAELQLPSTNALDVLSVSLELYQFLFLLAIGWASHLVLVWFNLYKSKRLEGWRQEARDLLYAMIIITAGVLLFTRPAGFEIPSAPLLATIFLTLAYTVTLGTRLVLRGALRRVRRAGRNLNHVLIVGTNHRARRAANEMQSRPELGCRLVGFVDDRWHDPSLAASHQLVASLDTLHVYLRDHVVDEVVICVPIKSCYDAVVRAVESCQEQGISVRLGSDLFADEAGGFDEYKVLFAVLAKKDRLATFVKRVIDVVVASTLLIVLAPLLVGVALLIRRTSPGPALFVQERVGLNKRRFKLYKFRTMVADAQSRRADLEHLNETAGPTFKVTNDPRVTPLGRILRKTSIDELPQLINVLLGDMSLVGPRPLPVLDYAGFASDRHRKRLSVPPGITCLWQVEGRSSIPFERWMELDLQYIDSWSLWLDVKILVRTIPAVLRAAGAS